MHFSNHIPDKPDHKALSARQSVQSEVAGLGESRLARISHQVVGWVEQAEDRVGLRSLATPGSRTDCHSTIRRLVTPTLGLSLA